MKRPAVCGIVLVGLAAATGVLGVANWPGGAAASSERKKK